MSNETNIQQRVLEKIRSGKVAMRPRLYFMLRLALIGTVAVAAFLASVFALSFALFSVEKSGEAFLLGFGSRGIATFLALFPWWTSLLAVALLILLEALVRDFSYRLPLLRLFLAALAVAALGSVLLAATPLHAFLLSRADRDALPLLGPLYEGIHDNHWDHGVYRGYVTAKTGTGFIISHSDTDLDSDDGSWTILPPQGFDLSAVSTGEKAYVLGQFENGIVHASDIELTPVK